MQIKDKKINIFVGLKKKDMKTDLNTDKTINIISNDLIKIGVSGFNVSQIKGYYENKPENTLLISFFNNYNVNFGKLKSTINNLKQKLEQENIIIEIEPVKFQFI